MFANFGNRTSVIDNIKLFFGSNSPLARFISINIFVFIATIVIGMLSGVYRFLFNMEAPNSHDFPYIIDLFMLPASVDQLLAKPWTLFSYQFLHVSFWHIFFNMIMLYVSGKIFLSFLRSRQFIWVYILGGLSGAVFYILAYNYFPVFSTVLANSRALGASASILGILTCVAVFVPNYQISLLFIGRVNIKWIAIFFVVIDVLSINKGNAGGHIAHLGGAFWGLMAGLYYKEPFFIKIKKRVQSIFKKRRFKKIYYSAPPANKISDDEYNAQRAKKQKEIDLILDKISKHGYEKLSKEEKEFLFKSSNPKK